MITGKTEAHISVPENQKHQDNLKEKKKSNMGKIIRINLTDSNSGS